MKKITFLITALLVTFQLHTSAQFISGFGIKGGVTFSNQKFTIIKVLTLTLMKNKYHGI